MSRIGKQVTICYALRHCGWNCIYSLHRAMIMRRPLACTVASISCILQVVYAAPRQRPKRDIVQTLYLDSGFTCPISIISAVVSVLYEFVSICRNSGDDLRPLWSTSASISSHLTKSTSRTCILSVLFEIVLCDQLCDIQRRTN
jgi:hypothetical protein